MTTSRRVLKAVSTSVATASLMVAFGAKTHDIHADTISDPTQGQNTADQLANLAVENTAKEAQMEADNNIANRHDADQMNQQIQAVNDGFTQQEKAVQPQIDAAKTAMQQEIKENSVQVNQSIDGQIKDQQTQNQQAEANLQQNNQAQLEQAQQEIANAQANAQQTINHAKADLTTGQQQNDQTRNQQIKAENTNFDQQKAQTDQNLQNGQNKINSEIQNAQQALDKANQDVKDHTTTKQAAQNTITRVNNALDDQGDGTIFGSIPMTPAQMDQLYPKTKWNNPVYRSTQLGLYASSMVDYNQQNAPKDITDMPTDFQPGLIVYNPNLDHSEVIGKNGLNEHQKQIIASFGVSWANGFRHWIHDNEPAVWNYANKNKLQRDMPVQDLKYNQTMVNVAKDIENKRLKNNIDNNHHTYDTAKLPSMDKINTEYKKASSNIDFDADPDHTVMMNQGSMENLDTVMPYINHNGEPTLLGYLIAAYNVAQPMWYGEINNSKTGEVNIGGHTRTVLNNDINYMTVAMTKCDDPKAGDNKTSLNNRKDHPVDYAMTFDGFTYNPTVINNTTDGKFVYKAINPATTKLNNKVNEIKNDFDKVMGPSAFTQEFIETQNKAKQPSGKTITTTPQQYLDAAKKAQNELDTLIQNKDNKLQKLNNTHNATIKKLTDEHNNKIKSINDAHDQKAKELEHAYQEAVDKAHGKTASIDQLKNELDQKYHELVKADQAKIDQLEKSRQEQLANVKQIAQNNYDAKIKTLGIDNSVRDTKIKALKDSHNKFVQENADKLAKLKADDQKTYNKLKAKLDAEANKNHTVQIGDHTVTLPDDKKDTKDIANEAHNDSPVNNTKEVNKNTTNNTIEPTANTTTSEHIINMNAGQNTEITNPTATVKTDKGRANTVPTSTTTMEHETTNAVPKTREEVKQTEGKLPQTGNAGNNLSVLGLLAGAFGLGLASRKRRQENN